MNEMDTAYATVQQEADATRDFGLRDFGLLVLLTLGIGLVLVLIGALQ